MVREDLKNLGLDDAVITKVLNLHHGELTEYKEKASQLEGVKAAAEKLKADFDEQSEKLKALESGDDSPEKLKAEILKLTTAATTKDAEHKAALEKLKTELEDNRFNAKLNTFIGEAGAKRAKAILAELNIDELKASKNQDEDIKKAIEVLKKGEETSFLFKGSEPDPAASGVNFPGGAKPAGEDAATAQARAIMGLKVEK